MPRLSRYAQEFTPGEKRIAALMAGGLTNRDIAMELNSSIKSVMIRVYNVYTKISGLDDLVLPEDGVAKSSEIRKVAVDFLKAHPHLYEDIPERA